MLISTATVSTPSQTSFANPKQIIVSTGTGAQLMYTVPAGKKFQGTMYSNATAMQISITPSGGAAVTFIIPSISQAPTTPPLPLTLVAGSIVTNVSGANNQHLVGVETDA